MVSESDLIPGKEYWYGVLGITAGQSFKVSTKTDIQKVKCSGVVGQGRLKFLNPRGEDIRRYYYYSANEIICETREEAEDEWNAIVRKALDKLEAYKRGRQKYLEGLLTNSATLPPNEQNAE